MQDLKAHLDTLAASAIGASNALAPPGRNSTATPAGVDLTGSHARSRRSSEGMGSAAEGGALQATKQVSAGLPRRGYASALSSAAARARSTGLPGVKSGAGAAQKPGSSSAGSRKVTRSASANSSTSSVSIYSSRPSMAAAWSLRGVRNASGSCTGVPAVPQAGSSNGSIGSTDSVDSSNRDVPAAIIAQQGSVADADGGQRQDHTSHDELFVAPASSPTDAAGPISRVMQEAQGDSDAGQEADAIGITCATSVVPVHVLRSYLKRGFDSDSSVDDEHIDG